MTACILGQGDPGTGKTGAVAAILDRGREVGIERVVLADFDGNPDPLLTYAKGTDRLHVLPFVETLKSDGADVKGDITRSGVSALRQFTKFLTAGTPELGKPRAWGPETLFVLDSLTSLSDSALRLALQLNRGVTRDGAHIGVAMGEIEDALSMVKQLACHRYVISHLKLIAPRPESSYGDETELQKQIKREIGSLQDTGYFANIPGNALARNIASKFSTALLFELSDKGVLQIRTKPIKGYVIKVPAPNVADRLPIETGLLTILEALRTSP